MYDQIKIGGGAHIHKICDRRADRIIDTKDKENLCACMRTAGRLYFTLRLLTQLEKSLNNKNVNF